MSPDDPAPEPEPEPQQRRPRPDGDDNANRSTPASNQGRIVLVVIEVIGALTTVASAVSWLRGKNLVLAASLCAAGVLLLALAALIARSKFQKYFAATLATLIFGVLLVGTATGYALAKTENEKVPVAGPGTTNPPSSPSPTGPSTPNPPSSPPPTTSPPPPPPPTTTPPTGEQVVCNPPPFKFGPSTARGTIIPPRTDGKASYRFTLTGTLQGVPDGRFTYISTEMTGPTGHPVWEDAKCVANPYPVAVEPDAQGRWTKQINIGVNNTEHSGLEFKITLLAVDKDMAALFNDYIANAEAREYKGVKAEDLKRFNAEEVASVTLKRL